MNSGIVDGQAKNSHAKSKTACIQAV